MKQSLLSEMPKKRLRSVVSYLCGCDKYNKTSKERLIREISLSYSLNDIRKALNKV